jgi:hypothetical protein
MKLVGPVAIVLETASRRRLRLDCLASGPEVSKSHICILRSKHIKPKYDQDVLVPDGVAEELR